MHRFHWGWLVSAVILITIVFIVSLRLFPDWGQSLTSLFNLTVADVIGVIVLLAALRQLIEAQKSTPPHIHAENITAGGDVTLQVIDNVIQQQIRSGAGEQDSLSTRIPVSETVRDVDLISKELTTRIESLIAERIGQVQEGTGPANQVALSAAPRPDSQVLAPPVYAPRANLVDELHKQLGDVDWLALVGGSGTGKTQLVRAVAQISGMGSVRWVSLQGVEGVQFHLHQQIALWAAQLKGDDRLWNELVHLDLVELGELVSEASNNSGLLVVDDLPDPVTNEPLFVDLESIARACSPHGLKLLTTSQRDLPSEIQIRLGAKLLVRSAPPFSQNDVLELLSSAGAPKDGMKGDPVSLILGTTSGHPALVVATVDWLRKHNWQLGQEELFALLGGDPTAGVRGDEVRRVLRFLEDRFLRFLFRLSLLPEEFNEAIAMRIAAVRPAIDYPGESLIELVGPFVDRLEGEKYRINPLLKDSGMKNLSADEQANVHRAVSAYYLSLGTIQASQVSTVAMHLWSANDFKSFAMFLIKMMLSIKTKTEAKYFEWIAGVFTGEAKWPAEIDLDLRIMFRALQVKVRSLAGSDITKLNTELEELLAQTGPDNFMSVIFACLNAGPLLEQMPPVIALQRAIKLVRLTRAHKVIPEEEFPGKYEDVIWFAVVGLRGDEQIQAFLEELQKMTAKEQKWLFDSDLATEVASYIVDSIWLAEANKPVAEQDWQRVLAFLDQVRNLASTLWLSALEVAEVRARSSILLYYLGQEDTGIDLLKAFPYPSNPDQAFLIDYTLGELLSSKSRNADALNRFESASLKEGDAFIVYRFTAKKMVAVLKGKILDFSDAIRRIVQVIRGVTVMADIFAFDKFEMMGNWRWLIGIGKTRRRHAAQCTGW